MAITIMNKERDDGRVDSGPATAAAGIDQRRAGGIAGAIAADLAALPANLGITNELPDGAPLPPAFVKPLSLDELQNLMTDGTGAREFVTVTVYAARPTFTDGFLSYLDDCVAQTKEAVRQVIAEKLSSRAAGGVALWEALKSCTVEGHYPISDILRWLE